MTPLVLSVRAQQYAELARAAEKIRRARYELGCAQAEHDIISHRIDTELRAAEGRETEGV